jgi:hypothetical protein
LKELDALYALSYALIQYGQHLYKRGMTTKGAELALKALAIQTKLGIDLDDVWTVLSEMNTNPNWRIPSPVVSLLIDNAFDIVTEETEKKNDFLQDLSRNLEHANEQDWSAEIEFLSAIYAIVDNQEVTLTEENPYIEPIQKLATAIAKHHLLNQIFATTIYVVTKEPDRKEYWQAQVSAMIVDSLLNGDTQLSTLLTGVIAFLREMPIDEAKKRLEDSAVELMISLDEAVKDTIG